MKRFGTLFASIAALALLALSPLSAEAQTSGASCPISAQSPVSKAASYTLLPSDDCGFIQVTSAATITLPASGTVEKGYTVWIKAEGATAVVTPSTGTLDGTTTSLSLTTGLGIGIRSDGTNYFTTGLGLSH